MYSISSKCIQLHQYVFKFINMYSILSKCILLHHNIFNTVFEERIDQIVDLILQNLDFSNETNAQI